MMGRVVIALSRISVLSNCPVVKRAPSPACVRHSWEFWDDCLTLRKLSHTLVVLVLASHLFTLGAAPRVCATVEMSTNFFSMIVARPPVCCERALLKPDRFCCSASDVRAGKDDCDCSEGEEFLFQSFENGSASEELEFVWLSSAAGVFWLP